MTFALGLECTAYGSLFLIHVMVGLGRPVTIQFKVRLEPITALWFSGPPTNSGAWTPAMERYISRVSLV